MTIQSEGNAPYAPTAAVVGIIERYRSHGLTEPFDTEVLERAGIPESLSARTLQALKLLDLVDDGGFPTNELRDLSKAPTNEFRDRLADVLRAAYAEVFSFVDPAHDHIDRVEDAFRGFRPRGQRARMVTLFLGLCEYAGIVTELPKRKPGPKREATNGRSSRASTAHASRSSGQNEQRPSTPAGLASVRLPPALAALLAELPKEGSSWTTTRRGSFISAFTALLDVYYPVHDTVDPRGELTAGSPQG